MRVWISASSTLGYPDIDVGLIPAIHYAYLPRIVGRHRAFDLLFTGRNFAADQGAKLRLEPALFSDLVTPLPRERRSVDRPRPAARSANPSAPRPASTGGALMARG